MFAPLHLAGFSTVSIWIDLSAELWLHGPPMAATAPFTFWLFAFEVNFGKACELWPLLSLSEFLDLLKEAGTGIHCVVRSKMALGRMVVGKEESAQDKSA